MYFGNRRFGCSPTSKVEFFGVQLFLKESKVVGARKNKAHGIKRRVGNVAVESSPHHEEREARQPWQKAIQVHALVSVT